LREGNAVHTGVKVQKLNNRQIANLFAAFLSGGAAKPAAFLADGGQFPVTIDGSGPKSGHVEYMFKLIVDNMITVGVATRLVELLKENGLGDDQLAEVLAGRAVIVRDQAVGAQAMVEYQLDGPLPERAFLELNEARQIAVSCPEGRGAVATLHIWGRDAEGSPEDLDTQTLEVYQISAFVWKVDGTAKYSSSAMSEMVSRRQRLVGRKETENSTYRRLCDLARHRLRSAAAAREVADPVSARRARRTKKKSRASAQPVASA